MAITGGSSRATATCWRPNDGTSITASYDSATETLVLAGSDTLANYQSVLDSVTFRPGENPDHYGSDPTRLITLVLDDGSASNHLSTARHHHGRHHAINDAADAGNAAVGDAFTAGRHRDAVGHRQ